MTDKQSRTYNMAATTEGLLEDNRTLWETTPAIVTKHTALGNSLGAIRTIQGVQENDTSGIAVLKELKKNTMATLARNIAGPLQAWARDNKRIGLLEEIDLSYSALFYVKDVTAIERATKVLARATTHIGSLDTYGILPDALPPLSDAIDQFLLIMNEPREGTSVKEAASTAMLEAFAAMNVTLLGLDNLLVPFSATEEEFYNEYLNARKIVDGGRKISLIVKLTDGSQGTIIQGAEVSLPEIEELLISTRTGNARFFSLPPGNFRLEITHPLYNPLAVPEVAIFDGQLTRLDIELDKRD